jgi:hypothetical protein
MSGNDGRPCKHLGSLGDVPYYIITFDKDGHCKSPAALDDLCKTVKFKTDVFMFSHGWNNDWTAVVARYSRFIERCGHVQRQWWKYPTRAFAPVLVGVFWPSVTLIAPWDKHPETTATAPPDIAVLAEFLTPGQQASLKEVVAKPSAERVAELADMVADVLSEIFDDEVGLDNEPMDPSDLNAMWIDMPLARDDYPDAGTARIVAADGSKFIRDHGAVETDETAWELLSRVRR